MRKIIFSIPITLDGFIEGPNHELDWVIADDDLHDFYSDMLEESDLMFWGRVTYELMLGYWPTASADPNLTRGMLRFANTINPMRKIVFSRTLKDAGWNAQVVQELVPADIQALKNQPGRDMLLGGGATLAQAFIKQGLVDEYRLLVQPAVIGKGTALFGKAATRQKLKLLWSRAFPSGAVALCYQPADVQANTQDV